MRKLQLENKSLNVTRVNKLIDEHRGSAPSARIEKGGTQVEIGEVTALNERGCTVALVRFNGRHPVSLPVEMIDGLGLALGSRIKLRVRVPEFAGFRGAGSYQAVAVLQVEEPKQ